MNLMHAPDSAIAAWLLSRGLSLVSLIAFLSAAVQIRGLIGSKGLIPASETLSFLGTRLGGDAILRFPTLFWLNSSDTMLLGLCFVGAFAAAAAFFGWAAPLMFGLCFVCYLSIVTAGREFFSFQWDFLLLETLFLAIWLGPWTWRWTPWLAPEPHLLVRVLFFLLLFKLMFLSGVVKIASQDETWRNLTALSVHYETQPIPNPLSWFIHSLPAWVHRASTAGMFVVELGLPFLILIPWTPARVVAAIGFIGLQILIFATGNYTFFNLLTVVLSLMLVPDSLWSRFPGFAERIDVVPASAGWFHLAVVLVAIPLTLMNLFWLFRPFGAAPWFSRAVIPLAQRLLPFGINNSYGLFAVMTRTRPELDVQGSDDGIEWKSYVFKAKPGPLDRRPPQVAPHQPRLDWQMWFAALGNPADEAWLSRLQIRLLNAEPTVLALLAQDPFAGRAPKFVRVVSSEYRFTTSEEKSRTGQWWKTGPARQVTPTMASGH